jgi:hypothetical protein
MTDRKKPTAGFWITVALVPHPLSECLRRSGMQRHKVPTRGQGLDPSSLALVTC